MYTLLIVDDEPTVVNGIADDIDWGLCNITEVYKAFSAKQALEQLESNARIDIVMTDIKMPGLDGLELAELVKNKWPHTKVIIMSGYDDFKLAQRAIDLNVYAYLTKPTPYEEITAVIQEALALLEREMKDSKLLLEAEKALQSHQEVLRDRYMTNWIVLGKERPDSNKRDWDKLRLQLNPSWPSLLVYIRVDQTNQFIADYQRTFGIRSLMQQYLLDKGPFLSFTDRNDHLVALVQRQSKEDMLTCKTYMEGMAEIFIRSVQHMYGCKISVFWSAIFLQLNEAHDTYEKLLSKAHKLIPLKDGGVIQEVKLDEQPKYTHIKPLYSYPDLHSLIDGSDKEQALSKIHDIFNALEVYPYIAYDVLQCIYHTIMSALLRASFKRGIEPEQWRHSDVHKFDLSHKLASPKQLKEWCITCLTDYFNYIQKQGVHESHHLLDRAKKEIGDALNKDLSIQHIAKTLHVHPNYLSRLFSREMGMSITDYMIMLRMEKAKSYLSDPSMKVFEVAELVGYESVSHFNRLFKRETGMSPKEYQNLNSM